MKNLGKSFSLPRKVETVTNSEDMKASAVLGEDKETVTLSCKEGDNDVAYMHERGNMYDKPSLRQLLLAYGRIDETVLSRGGGEMCGKLLTSKARLLAGINRAFIAIPTNKVIEIMRTI